MVFGNWNLKTIPFTITYKMWVHRDKLEKIYIQDPFSENHKTLLTEIEEDLS